MDMDLVKFFEKISEKWQHSIKDDSLTFILNVDKVMHKLVGNKK
jgi:hypothetical protein